MLLQLKILCVLIVIQSYFLGTDGACTFPTDLQSGVWLSSDMGNVTFNSTHFTVSEIVDFGSLTFECQELYSESYFVLSEPFNYLGVSSPFKIAICFKLVNSSSTNYLYYPQSSILANTDVSRIMFQAASYSFTAAETCADNDITIYKARVLIKEDESYALIGRHKVHLDVTFHGDSRDPVRQCSTGYLFTEIDKRCYGDNSSSVDCLNTISGIYSYNVSGSSCVNTSLDVCTDKHVMNFNYSYCPDIMAYSAGGQLRCVHQEEVDSLSYVILYNEDNTTDESTYYRFTCLVSNASVDGGPQQVITYPRACNIYSNESYTASPWVTFEMTANSTCLTLDITTTKASTSSDSTLSAGGALAIVIGLLVLIAAGVVIGGVYYIKVHKMKKVNPDMIAAKSPPIDTKEQERNLDGRVSPFSPYPTVSELAVYRFGPSPGPEIDDDDGGMTLEATTPGFTDGRRTMYGKDVERESQVSLPMYSEVGGETPEPTRLSEVHTRMSEISEVNIADPTPFTMTRATMNIPEETRVSPLQTPTDGKPNGAIQSPRDNGGPDDVTL